jgi:rhodanese-related sulfurtransferase
MNTEQPTISVQQAAALIDNPEVLFLDVREDDEVAFCKIASSLHIPMDQMGERLEYLPKDKRIIVYCHHGMRSWHVCQFLSIKGYAQVQNLTGGIDAWSCEIDSSLPRY